MRRQSFSAPARLCLDRLDTATENLGQRISSLSLLVSRSSSSLNKDPAETMPRTCHGCHAPLDEDHQAFPSGWQKCQLEHWEGCKGGIEDGKSANGSDWRGCPDGYVCVEQVDDESGSDEDVTGDGLKENDITIDTGKIDDTLEKADADLVNGASAGAMGTDEKSPGDSLAPETDEADLQLQQLEAANLLLKKQAALREQQMNTERDRRIAMLHAENIKLSKSMKGDIGGAKIKHGQAVGSLHPNPKNVKVKRTSNLDRTVLPPLQTHLTRNQLRDSEYRPEETSLYSGLNINGIRKIPVIQTEVDRLIAKVQNHAPSLDSRPSFRLDKTLPSSSLPDPRPRLGSQLGKLDPETSSDEDVDEQPRPGFVFRWRRDQNGEKYFEEEKEVTVQDTADLVYRYVRDEATGRSYKRLVLKTDPHRELTPQWVIDPRTGKQVQMLVPCQPSSLQKKSDQRSLGQKAWTIGSPKHSDGQEDTFVTPLPPTTRRKTPQLSSSAPSRIPDVHQDDKQGKMPSIVHYARGCPVSWTTKITSDKLNLGLWSWAYIAELLASRNGQAPSLQHGELEAKLQHYLNVLEIALQPSNPSDFDNHAWRVARLYGEKVQQKVDRGDTWLGFEKRYGSDSQPHELMAAEKELAPKVVKSFTKVKDEVNTRGGKPSDDPPSRKRTCTTWNTSTVEGKCEYEVTNDGRSCSRRHECSWCKEKGKTALSHQRSFCRQRIAAGDQ